MAIYTAQLYDAREQALLDTIAALAHAIEAKDGYTGAHAQEFRFAPVAGNWPAGARTVSRSVNAAGGTAPRPNGRRSSSRVS